mgnify:CR=1 FL=1
MNDFVDNSAGRVGNPEVGPQAAESEADRRDAALLADLRAGRGDGTGVDFGGLASVAGAGAVAGEPGPVAGEPGPVAGEPGPVAGEPGPESGPEPDPVVRACLDCGKVMYVWRPGPGAVDLHRCDACALLLALTGRPYR